MSSTPDFEIDAPIEHPRAIILEVFYNHLLVHCPFCGEQHKHGRGSGFRMTHCKRGGMYYIEDAEIDE